MLLDALGYLIGVALVMVPGLAWLTYRDHRKMVADTERLFLRFADKSPYPARYTITASESRMWHLLPKESE